MKFFSLSSQGKKLGTELPPTESKKFYHIFNCGLAKLYKKQQQARKTR
jgi:hypothetical protein